MARPSRGLFSALALTLLTGGVVVAAATTGSDNNLGGATAQRERGSHQHPKRPPGEKPCHKDNPEGHTSPARISGEHAAGTTSSILLPVNAWSAADCQQWTQVEAGAAGWHASAGIFVINRFHGSSAERPRFIVVPDSGAVRITHAPLGPKVVTWAQHRGELEFRGKRRLTGTVNLGDDTVTLSTGTVIQATDRPFSGAG